MSTRRSGHQTKWIDGLQTKQHEFNWFIWIVFWTNINLINADCQDPHRQATVSANVQDDCFPKTCLKIFSRSFAWTKEQNTPSFPRDVSAAKAKDLMIPYDFEMLGCRMIIAKTWLNEFESDKAMASLSRLPRTGLFWIRISSFTEFCDDGICMILYVFDCARIAFVLRAIVVKQTAFVLCGGTRLETRLAWSLPFVCSVLLIEIVLTE